MKQVIRQHTIDPYTTIRKRVPLRKDTCMVCGFSVTQRNNLPAYEELDAATQAGVRGALKEHKRVAHPHSERALLSDSETPTSWLNGEETIRKDH